MSACIRHQGYLDKQGYGRVQKERRFTMAHRFAWEAENGAVPLGYELHHTCGVKSCVNPEHLQAVTRSEHQRIHRRKAYCKSGHAMTPGNTYIRPSGGFDCRACIRERVKRYRTRRAAA